MLGVSKPPTHSPNPRLQRTRSASPPSPLSRQPLGRARTLATAVPFLGLLVVVGGASSGAASRTTPEGIPGVYQSCVRPGLCTRIELRTDGTFSYLPADPVIKWDPLEGNWRLIEPGLLLANSAKQHQPLPLKAAADSSLLKLRVCVSDNISGRPLASADVTIDADGISAGGLTTGADSCLELPRYHGVWHLSVSHSHYESVEYQVAGIDANLFDITLKGQEPYVTNQKWLLTGGRLYVLAFEPLSPK